MSTAAVHRPSYPRRFGPYVLIEPLEQGPLDQVSMAFVGDTGTEILCVVQRLSRNLAEEADRLARFRDQTALARRLSHGNLVATHAIGQIDREPFIAQEFVEGHDLADVCARCAAERVHMPVEIALYIVSQVARGLAYAHDFEGLQLIHGDINPSKIRLSYSGEVKLLGFGLTGCRSRPTEAAPLGWAREGSPYRAPDKPSGHPLDRRADLYAVGVVLWELLAQGRYDDMKSPMAPSLANPVIPVVLDRLVSKAVARNPEERFQTADELRATIGERLPSAFNIEWMLADLLAKLYDVPREREHRAGLISAGGRLWARRSTGQNPLLPAKTGAGGRAGDERTPAPTAVPPALALPEPPPRPPIFRSRAQRYRWRVAASSAFVVLSLMAMAAIVLALRYASLHPSVAAAAAPSALEAVDAAFTPD